MKEEEKLRVDKMAHDLEIKWTENLRYIFYSVMSSYQYRCAEYVFLLYGLYCLIIKAE